MSDGQCAKAFTPRKGGPAQVRPKAGAGSVARERLRRRAKGLGQELDRQLGSNVNVVSLLFTF